MEKDYSKNLKKKDFEENINASCEKTILEKT